MRTVGGDTKLLGLLSHQASYTLSPAIHNSAIHEFGLDQVYVNFDLTQDHIKSFLDLFWQLGGVGLNVTKPHKGWVAGLLSNCALTSVNTLSRGASGWIGHSTDGAGFARGLERLDLDLSHLSTITLLGSGGAAQAILQYVASDPNSKISDIFVIRRSDVRDAAICKIVDSSVQRCAVPKVTFLPWTVASLSLAVEKSLGLASLMIQASSAPTLGDDLSGFLPALDAFSGAFVDLLYDRPSALYFTALHKGLKTQDGLPMLIEQARLSQLIWWGKCASYESLALAIKRTGRFTAP